LLVIVYGKDSFGASDDFLIGKLIQKHLLRLSYFIKVFIILYQLKNSDHHKKIYFCKKNYNQKVSFKFEGSKNSFSFIFSSTENLILLHKTEKKLLKLLSENYENFFRRIKSFFHFLAGQIYQYGHQLFPLINESISKNYVHNPLKKSFN